MSADAEWAELAGRIKAECADILRRVKRDRAFLNGLERPELYEAVAQENAHAAGSTLDGVVR